MEETASSTVLTLLTATVAGKWWSVKDSFTLVLAAYIGKQQHWKQNT